MGSKREAAKAKRKWEQRVAPALTASREIDRHLADDAAAGARPQRYSPQFEGLRQVSYSVMRQWKQNHKATYLVDNTLLRELSGTPLPEGFVPHSVFRRLPHATPLFVFETPLPTKITSVDGEIKDALLTGFIVEPFRQDRSGHSAHTICFFGWDANLDEAFAGTTRIAAEARITQNADGADLVLATEEGIDLRLLVSVGCGEYGFLGDESLTDEEAEKIEQLNGRNPFYTTVVPTMLNLILYATVEDPDLTHIPVPVVAGRHVVGDNAAKIHLLGFRLGSLLRGLYRDPVTGCEPSGRTVIPHLRRAHWHRYWTGPRSGERQIVVRWVSQTLVNADAGDYTPAVRPLS